MKITFDIGSLHKMDKLPNDARRLLIYIAERMSSNNLFIMYVEDRQEALSHLQFIMYVEDRQEAVSHLRTTPQGVKNSLLDLSIAGLVSMDDSMTFIKVNKDSVTLIKE